MIKKHPKNQLPKNGDDNLQKLYKSALKFLEPTNLDETYKKVVDEAIKLVGANHGSIFLKNSSGLERVYTFPPLPSQNKTRETTLTYRALFKNEPTISKNGSFQTIYTPLVNKSRKVGLLSISLSKSSQNLEKQLSVLKIFGSIASMAIRKAQLYDEIKTTIGERDLFISLAAHEIRTPLTVVLLYAELIQKSVSADKMPNKKWSNIVLDESKRLRSITDELLGVEQIKTGLFQYSFNQINLNSLLYRAISSFKIVHKNNHVNFTDNTEKDIQVIADANKLLQVITNILNNAAKYSPEKSTIDINLSQRANNVYLSIKDKGAGIEKADIKNIFDLYYQSGRNGKRGLGIGLYLAKMIIEMHKGKISVKSKVNVGTKITIKLPKLKKKPSTI